MQKLLHEEDEEEQTGQKCSWEKPIESLKMTSRKIYRQGNEHLSISLSGLLRVG